MDLQHRLDIILPCFNPPPGWAEALPAMIQEIAAALGARVSLRLILVNDGSRQGVSEADLSLLRQAFPDMQYITYEQNCGKGHALREGAKVATGDFQIYTDIDLPYQTESVVQVYEALRAGADVAAGVRDHAYYTHVPTLRRWISKSLRWMLKTFLRTQINDTQCGLKGFNARGRDVFLRTRIERFLFDMEFIVLASNEKGIRLAPVPVTLKPGITFSKARLGILFKESLNFWTIFWRGLFRRG